MFIQKRKHLRINLRLIGAFMAFLTIVIVYREIQKAKERAKQIDLPQIHVQGELRALTLYSPTSYFIYRDKEMGYEYEICSKMANDLGLHLKMVVAPNPAALTHMLEQGQGDLIAYNIPITIENKQDYLYCGREFLTHQVLVQQNKEPKDMVHGVTGLIGKTVVVHANSRYLSRLKSLNEELGGGIKIHIIRHDSLSVEELTGLVSTGKIDYTIADNNIAQFNKTFYKNINIDVPISFSQHSSWAVRKRSPKLAKAIDRWFSENLHTPEYLAITKKYFETGKSASSLMTTEILIGKKGQISMFDDLFKKYGATIGWDWHLLASIAWQESNFDPSAENWIGAKGLMQIMPKTAHSVGIDRDSLFNPTHNVLAATRLLRTYERKFGTISSRENRLKLTLAAYNCGLGHVIDARALARKYGKNANIWEGNVKTYIQLKSRPEYYEDPVCKQGYLRGSETSEFVTEVWSRYKRYVRLVPDTKKKKKRGR
jgi:membrane-bound lytic murein transglycosylase F